MPFEPHEPHVMLVEFDMDSPLLFFSHLKKGTRLLDSEIVRLRINQSVCSWSEGYI
jgi:hypothetical protein